jgi:uncharacterized protein (TIGR03437 family)
MQKFNSKFLPVCLVIACSAPLAPVYRAQQPSGAATRVMTVPSGAHFTVDGQDYQSAMSSFWPAGSKHTLYVAAPQQDQVVPKTRLTFKFWEYAGGQLPGNPAVVTADPNFAEYRAVFDVQYALMLRFFSCPDPDPSLCHSAGAVYVNGTAYNSDADLFFPSGSAISLTAYPNPGYVFGGWTPGVGQAITGFVNNVTLNGPVEAVPLFQVARKMTLHTIPEGLILLADRAQVPTPAVLDWGWGSTHTLGAITPQTDQGPGKYWVFSSWSDGGALNHAYKVPSDLGEDSVTATFIPGAASSISTQPPGLKLMVDGRNTWASYNFVWGVGETHHVEAPAQLTDASGHLWAFDSWSSGGPAAQDVIIPDGADSTGFRMIATYNPLGQLTVTSPMTSLSVQIDGSDCATPCKVVRPAGTQVRVTAPASLALSAGSRADFKGWPGAAAGATDFTATLNSDPATVVANYRMLNRLAASSDPPDGANWQVQPASPDGFYDTQTTVNVSLSAKPGFRFHQWAGDLSGTTPAGALSMSAPRTVRALLDRVPYIPQAGVANAAGVTPQKAVAPGSVVSIFGASLANAVTVGPDSPLGQTLGGLTVRIGDRLVPLFFVSPGQINFQAPSDLGEGDQVLTVSAAAQPDVRATFSVLRNAPGVFQQAIGDQTYALALHEDGSVVTPDSPARVGELLTVYGTGFGPTNPPRIGGFAIPTSPAFNIVDGAAVVVGDVSLDAEKAFAVPGRVGIDAVQFRLTSDVPSGANASLLIRINGQDSNTLLLPVQ